MIIQNKLSIENNQKQIFNKTIYEIILISKYQGQKMKNKKKMLWKHVRWKVFIEKVQFNFFIITSYSFSREKCQYSNQIPSSTYHFRIALI